MTSSRLDQGSVASLDDALKAESNSPSAERIDSNASPGEVCPACAGSEFSTTRDVGDHEYEIDAIARYVRCIACGSETQSPMPDDETLASFYPEGYHSFSGQGLPQLVRNDLRIRRLSRNSS